jgi:uncharacterized membrane protein
MRWTIERSLKRWQEEGLLTDEKVAELRASLVHAHSARGIRIFAALGAVLAGLGVILFVSSNWAWMGPAYRIAVLVAAYAAVVAGAVTAGRRDQPRVAEAMWLLATIALGANIFLIAQIYHFHLTYWQGTLRWMIGALVLGWVLRSRFQAAVAIPLGLLTLGWLGSGGGWFFPEQWDFLFTDWSLRPILPLIGLGLVSLSLLAVRGQSWEFLRGSSFGWGLGLLMTAAVASTAGVSVAEWFFAFAGSSTQFAILAGVAILLAGAMAFGRFHWPRSRLLLGSTAALFILMLVQIDDVHWLQAEIGGLHLLFGAYVVAVFMLALLTIWTGVKSGRTVLVNAGMVTSAFLIFSQYLSWSFELLDRSLAFVIGGLLLLGLAVVLEKKRRALLEQMDLAGGEMS